MKRRIRAFVDFMAGAAMLIGGFVLVVSWWWLGPRRKK